MVETHGPDKCRSSLACADFHEPVIDRMGSMQHCCCCNTCHSVRPGLQGDSLDFLHCCRCLPRMILLQFTGSSGTGSGSGTECCRDTSVPMIYETTDVNGITTYTGTIYGYNVVAKVGRTSIGSASITGSTGTGTGEDCFWHITVSGEGVLNNAYIIDHVEFSCLDVANIELGEVVGPTGCVGSLSLANMKASRLPFLLRTDIGSVTSLGAATGTGTGTSHRVEFIDLDPPCGSCTQVCSKLCVYGNRTVGSAREWVEFTWFDDAEGRGWEYTPPSTGVNERIYLGNGADTGTGTGDCTLIFSWPGSEVLDDRPIDLTNGCSCGIKEVITATDAGVETIGFTIRCGFCTCWEMFCGTCRCVPTELCVQTYIDNVFTPDVILSWNSVIHCWENSLGVGAGGDRSLLLCLESDSDGECSITASVDGAQVGQAASHSCGDEHPSRDFDPVSDFVSAFFEGDIDIDGFTGTATGSGTGTGNYTWISASSQLEDCRVGKCTSATPCADECGSHPKTLTATLAGWNDPILDEPDITGSCDLEVTLHYWETVTWANGLDYTCGYIGIGFVGWCPQIIGPDLPKWVLVELGGGELNLHYGFGYPLGIPCDNMTALLLTESCDPYYGDTGVIVPGIMDCCASCGEEIQRFQVIITE